ncbi:MAG: sigma 54-interacting transcriptional regulator [Planctomycetes bacterium]|nr:sigma 54-interacting transcriptional regulator [Planctomycetota bacterium]
MGDQEPAAAAAESPREPWGSWSSLFQRCADPVFLLSRRRQLRFVNHAWESLTGKTSEQMRGSFCLPRKKKGPATLRTLLEALAPSPEVLAGRSLTIRRAAPPGRTGPPWWDVTFIPLHESGGLTGILGFIQVVEPQAAAANAPGLSDALIALRQATAARYSFQLLHSESVAMQRVEAQARLAAGSNTPTWIEGASSTGKETLARIIHFQGVSRERTFMAIDCRGLQPYLIRNMLFGHSAQSGDRLGTVYLKDAAELSLDLQAEMIEWFEEQEEPPRIITGTNETAEDALRSGKFSGEYYSSFNVLPIRLPSLNERPTDLPRLATLLLWRAVGERNRPPEVAPETSELLRRHTWPGNLHELSDVLREALIASDGRRLEPAHLPLYLRTGETTARAKPEPTLDELLEQVEKRMIQMALKKAKGNKSEAAEALGIPRARLLRRMEMLNV